LGRGFGSSAAAVVLGLTAARRLVAPDLPDAELLALACELEGHPDNATPCLHGGATLAWGEDGRPRWRGGPGSPEPGAGRPGAPARAGARPGRPRGGAPPSPPPGAPPPRAPPEPMAPAEARRLLPERVP